MVLLRACISNVDHLSSNKREGNVLLFTHTVKGNSVMSVFVITGCTSELMTNDWVRFNCIDLTTSWVDMSWERFNLSCIFFTLSISSLFTNAFLVIGVAPLVAGNVTANNLAQMT